ncbi:hypothetical protein [Microvirga massiliensis]|uniref:hypothetical protein n=1 Tax=Microvirga massiliensis TaxID=1033741 RepID=UPI00065FD362|nr:hypothetical protein [Microvirga massiliensis]
MTLPDLLCEIAPPDERSPEALRRSAVHEAAHACVARLTGAAVRQVSILMAEGSGGHTATHAPDMVPTRRGLENLVMTALAGRAGEEALCGGPSAGTESDLAFATSLLAAIHGSLGLGDSLLHRGSREQVHALLAVDPALRRAVEDDLGRLYAGTLALVREHRGFVEALAGALVAERQISGERFEALFLAHARARQTVDRARPRGGRHGG